MKELGTRPRRVQSFRFLNEEQGDDEGHDLSNVKELNYIISPVCVYIHSPLRNPKQFISIRNPNYRL
jgi:hypothetical protein